MHKPCYSHSSIGKQLRFFSQYLLYIQCRNDYSCSVFWLHVGGYLEEYISGSKIAKLTTICILNCASKRITPIYIATNVFPITMQMLWIIRFFNLCQ